MNQHRLWSDPRVVEERRPRAEAFMGREMELPGRRYSPTEKRASALHLRAVEATEREPGDDSEAGAA